MGMRDDTAEHAHDSEEDCVEETTTTEDSTTTEETRVSSGSLPSHQPRHANPVIPTFHYSNDTRGAARAHALEGGTHELESVGVADNEAILRTQSQRIRVYAVINATVMCALCWYAHNTKSDMWDKFNVGIFACTAWLFPSFYCHAFQEWIFTDHAPRFLQRLRAMGHMDFFDLPATDWSRALSCFCVNTFAANFAYLISALFVAEQEDMFVLGCVVGIHCILWLGLITMHRMIPRPDTVFDLNNRLLRGQHAQNFINALAPVVVPSIFKMVLENWDALFSKRDEYTVAFTAVFVVDGLYYTLNLFNTDDPMWALIRQPGRTSVEVFNLQSLMMAMLAKFVWVIGTLFLSDRAKRMWISVELVVQVVSLIAVTWVSNRYVPDQASGSIRSHAYDIGAKVAILCSLFYAGRGDLFRISAVINKTVLIGFFINKCLNKLM